MKGENSSKNKVQDKSAALQLEVQGALQKKINMFRNFKKKPEVHDIILIDTICEAHDHHHDHITPSQRSPSK